MEPGHVLHLLGLHFLRDVILPEQSLRHKPLEDTSEVWEGQAGDFLPGPDQLHSHLALSPPGTDFHVTAESSAQEPAQLSAERRPAWSPSHWSPRSRTGGEQVEEEGGTRVRGRLGVLP